MNETASKKNPAKTRSPAVSFAATATGLSIRIAMPRELAKALTEKTEAKPRAKAKVSKAVLSALRGLENEKTRDRSGFLQADIPSQLKAQLMEVANANGSNVTALISDRLCEWINPHTGQLRLRKNKVGAPSRAGPKNYRDYVRPTKTMYSAALKTHSLARLQVEVGYKVAGLIEDLLYENRISKGEFLTALAADVKVRLSQCPP